LKSKLWSSKCKWLDGNVLGALWVFLPIWQMGKNDLCFL